MQGLWPPSPCAPAHDPALSQRWATVDAKQRSRLSKKGVTVKKTDKQSAVCSGLCNTRPRLMETESILLIL